MARPRRHMTFAGERGVWCTVTGGYGAVQYQHPDEANSSPSEILRLSISNSYCLYILKVLTFREQLLVEIP